MEIPLPTTTKQHQNDNTNISIQHKMKTEVVNPLTTTNIFFSLSLALVNPFPGPTLFPQSRSLLLSLLLLMMVLFIVTLCGISGAIRAPHNDNDKDNDDDDDDDNRLSIRNTRVI